MGEWSEYFEDFPEENSANWVNGKFDPQQAQHVRSMEAKLIEQHRATNFEVNKLRAKAKLDFIKHKQQSLMLVEDCPQCGLKELNTYKLNENHYLCECQDCGIYGEGRSHEDALSNTASVIGDGLDWRDENIS